MIDAINTFIEIGKASEEKLAKEAAEMRAELKRAEEDESQLRAELELSEEAESKLEKEAADLRAELKRAEAEEAEGS